MSKKNTYNLDSDEVYLIIEALKKQRTKVEQERLYRTRYSREFYDIRLEQYWSIISKLDRPISKKEWKNIHKFTNE
jgi:hypothetical protein